MDNECQSCYYQLSQFLPISPQTTNLPIFLIFNFEFLVFSQGLPRGQAWQSSGQQDQIDIFFSSSTLSVLNFYYKATFKSEVQ